MPLVDRITRKIIKSPILCKFVIEVLPAYGDWHTEVIDDEYSVDLIDETPLFGTVSAHLYDELVPELSNSLEYFDSIIDEFTNGKFMVHIDNCGKRAFFRQLRLAIKESAESWNNSVVRINELRGVKVIKTVDYNINKSTPSDIILESVRKSKIERVTTRGL